MIKVAFFNHTSTVSGAEISMLLTAKHMKRTDVRLFAPAGELADRATSAGLAYVELPSYRARMSKNPIKLIKGLLGMAWGGVKLARAVKAEGIDLIHANSLRAGMMASMFRWLHRKPVIWHIRDMPPSGLVGSGIRLLARLGTSRLIGISSAVFQGMRSPALAVKSCIVHNGVELVEMEEFTRTRHRKQLRQELQTSASSFVLVLIGQIAPWKRQEDAILALKSLLDQGCDVVLWIVGEPKFREENKQYAVHLEQLAQGLGIAHRVRFTGFRNDVLELCNAAELLLLCSDNEPFGRVLIEAMSQGIPVVATAAGGVTEIVKHEEDGLLYEVGEAEQLASEIKRLYDRPGLRNWLGCNAELKAKAMFDINRTSRRIEEVYRDVHQGRPSLQTGRGEIKEMA
ncbi:glycosyltransferase family 4 protein [Paenibacillus pinihumi]|uniref:glycosyltransferase family 4 protein n=1 Tax=Paenibacillus pinihumi TaxID=669462 RepID=UPI0003FC25F1|nr:glycosyltransferase family 4 protein [Paenibacillus pinihumi]